MKKIIVAIDGFSSCGKSTIAKALAKHAGYRYVDTGAMYRSVALYTIENKPEEMAVEPFLEQHIGELNIDFSVQPDGSQHTRLNGCDVEARIRTLEERLYSHSFRLIFYCIERYATVHCTRIYIPIAGMLGQRFGNSGFSAR